MLLLLVRRLIAPGTLAMLLLAMLLLATLLPWLLLLLSRILRLLLTGISKLSLSLLLLALLESTLLLLLVVVVSAKDGQQLDEKAHAAAAAIVIVPIRHFQESESLRIHGAQAEDVMSSRRGRVERNLERKKVVSDLVNNGIILSRSIIGFKRG